MDGVLARLYDRLGRFYLFAPWAFIWLNALALVVIFVELVAAQYIGLSPSRVLGVVLRAWAGITIAIGVVAVLVGRASMPVMRWIGGRRDEDTPEEVWLSAIGMPNRFVIIGGPFALVGSLPAVMGILDLIVLPWYSVFAIIVGVALVIGMGLTLDMAALVAFLRPVLAEIDATHPVRPDLTQASTSSLRRRIVAATLLVVITSAWLTTGVTARVSSPAAIIGLTVVAGVGIGLTFSLVLTLALSQSLMGPVKDLVEATKRVASGDLTARVPQVSNDEFGHLARSFNEMTKGLAERAALHSALGTYIEPTIADRLLREGEILSGEQTEATIMFIDIVGFTAIAERLRPEEVVSQLNEFFWLVIPVIQDLGGHANKLLGDGLMAVFGAPVPLDDHADRALSSAFAIQRRLCDRYGTSLRAGIGLNSGAVIAGTTGGGTKLDFTVLGDAVNVAQRVEALTRETGDEILLTDSTRDRLTTGASALVPRGRTTIKGRETPVMVFAALDRIPA